MTLRGPGYALDSSGNPTIKTVGIVFGNDVPCELDVRNLMICDMTIMGFHTSHRWGTYYTFMCGFRDCYFSRCYNGMEVPESFYNFGEDMQYQHCVFGNIENDAFYEIALLPFVWQWLEKYQAEGDDARLHSGPTVQDAIAIMEKHGLDWSSYSAFCYNSWPSWPGGIDPETGQYRAPYPAGDDYSFRKEELLLWMLRATVERQKSIEARLLVLDGKKQ